MSNFMAQLFTVDELVKELNFPNLTPQELAIIKAAIRREIYNSSQIKEILKERIRQVYDQIKSSSASQSLAASPPPQEPAASLPPARRRPRKG